VDHAKEIFQTIVEHVPKSEYFFADDHVILAYNKILC